MYFLEFPYVIFFLLFMIWTGVHDAHAQLVQNLAEDQDYNLNLDRALEWQQKADSSFHVSVEWRKQADKMDDPLERGRLQQKIMIIEDSIQIYWDRADRYFAALDQPRNPFITLDTILHGIGVYHYNLNDDFQAKLKELNENGDTEELRKQSDSEKSIEFEIFPASPYNSNHQFEYDFVPPEGTFYRIQLVVYSKEIAPDNFAGLFPITTEKIPEKGMTRYFAGKFSRLDNARTALLKVRSAGFPDAFIIGYFDGVKGTLDKLRALEKEL